MITSKIVSWTIKLFYLINQEKQTPNFLRQCKVKRESKGKRKKGADFGLLFIFEKGVKIGNFFP